MKKTFLILIFFISIFMLGYAQQDDNSVDLNSREQSLQDSSDTQLAERPLPKGINGIELGMKSSEVIERLVGNELFSYVPKYFRMSSKYEKSILSVEGRGFIDMAYFYFSEDDILVSFSLFLKDEYISYGTVFSDFQNKYGRSVLTPEEAKWADGNVSISVEQPLSIKFVLEEYIPSNEGEVQKEELVLDREKFLDYFK